MLLNFRGWKNLEIRFWQAFGNTARHLRLTGDWPFMDFPAPGQSLMFALECITHLLVNLLCLSNPWSQVQRISGGSLAHSSQCCRDLIESFNREVFLHVWVPCAKRNTAVVSELHVEHSWQPRPRCHSSCLSRPRKGEIVQLVVWQ